MNIYQVKNINHTTTDLTILKNIKTTNYGRKMKKENGEDVEIKKTRKRMCSYIGKGLNCCKICISSK